MSPPRIASTLSAAVTTLWLLALCVSPASSAPGDLVWTFQGIENINCMDVIEDQSGDGVPDVVVETYDAGATGDHLYCLSGGAPGPASVTLWSIKPPGGPSSSGGYGDECVRTTPDISGDGIEDVLLGTAWGGRTAYGIDGTNGDVLWDFDTYVDKPPNLPVSGWVYTVCSVPDVDGDAVPDVFFGCGSDNDRFYHVSGTDGSVHWSVDLVDAVFSSVGLDDVSGDGKADAAAGVGDYGDAVWCMRGGDTSSPTIWSRPMPGSVLGLARIEDVSGDSINDLLAGTWDSSVYALDGATGATVWVANFPGFAYVMQIVVLDDVNGDGTEDAVVGTWDDRVIVISGDDGSEIWSFPTGGDVWTVGRVDDVNFDGVNDVVGGSFDENVYVLDGTDGTMLWSFATGARLFYVMGSPDLTGNGTPDVLAGTQFLSPPGGRTFLLEGGEDVPTPAELPLLVTAGSVSGAVEISLEHATAHDFCVLERAAGTPNGAEAARAFRRDVVEAYRDGLLSADEAIRARSQDPRILWTRISDEPIPVLGGRASARDETAVPGSTYTYRFAFVAGSIVTGYSPPVTVTRAGPAAPAVPPLAVHPNPVGSGAVAIEFRLPSEQPIRLDAYDAAGRRVAEIEARAGAAGEVRVEWDRRGSDGRPLPSGVYFLRLEGRDFVSTKRVVLVG